MPTRPDVFIDPTAVVEEPCDIGEGSKIWHFSHVMPHAVIGRGCILGQNVFIASKVTIGDRVKIQNNVSVYTGVTLEDEVFCGPSVVFTNVINPRSAISRKHEFQPTRVGRGATLGANSTIVCGVAIGPYAFVGAGAVVTRDVPAYGLAYGNPARLKGWMCACGEGLRVRGVSACCQACGAQYRKRRGALAAVSP
ncbi:MAG: N-acetyltransferase [Candidatus Omnitrophica bacterium]|nr:N-acetyltransferase [Candidatus Omnitrophota bacterium]